MPVSDEDIQVNAICSSEKCLLSCRSKVSWDEQAAYSVVIRVKLLQLE
jgi:hypothetical protein